MKKILLLSILIVLAVATGYSQVKITSKEAASHVGDSVTVVDKVYGTKLLGNGMTLLNVGGDYPNQLLVLVIPGKDRAKFSYKPEVKLMGKQVLVSGKVSDYKGKPQLVVSDPKQITELLEGDPRLILKNVE